MNNTHSLPPLLQGKLALITGSNRGIGLATARAFAAQGAEIILNGRDAEALQLTASALELEFGIATHAFPFDVSSPEQVSSAFKSIHKQFKRLDVLVNNAGVLGDALLGMVTPELMEHTFSTNVFGILHCAQYAARLMARNNNGGSIINLSSIVGTHGNKGQSIYGGSKAAVIGITQSLAKELAPQSIRSNAIAPGFIDTDMTRSLHADIFAEREHSIAMGRIGTAEDVANVAVFLASDLSSYVTGQVIGVDGGMLI